MAILNFFASIVGSFTTDQAKRFLPHVLNPVHRILDENGDLAGEAGSGIGQSPTIILGSLAELRQLATEVRDQVQSKVGTTEFSRVWEKLRKRVSERREDRKDARNRLVSH